MHGNERNGPARRPHDEPNAQRVGAEFLAAADRQTAAGKRICGVRVPSVISGSDRNVLLDPRQKAVFAVRSWCRIPFDGLVGTST
jgi:RES domain-containing protein